VLLDRLRAATNPSTPAIHPAPNTATAH